MALLLPTAPLGDDESNADDKFRILKDVTITGTTNVSLYKGSEHIAQDVSEATLDSIFLLWLLFSAVCRQHKNIFSKQMHETGQGF